MPFVNEMRRLATQEPKPVMIPIPPEKVRDVAEHMAWACKIDGLTAEYFQDQLRLGNMSLHDVPLRIAGTISNWN